MQLEILCFGYAITSQWLKENNMPAKLKCPKCGTVLKEGTGYRELNFKIQCMACDYIGLEKEFIGGAYIPAGRVK